MDETIIKTNLADGSFLFGARNLFSFFLLFFDQYQYAMNKTTRIHRKEVVRDDKLEGNRPACKKLGERSWTKDQRIDEKKDDD
ncbi:hypothetical protein BSONL12_11696 [Bacillus sonorensis L12]|uniref:Uncharacterized protein n=1 Tax=Bacillus sonorensis L12 TaxID=1274524 RepID=M5P358_9BACI|nr:hypothetical protein BSONL12_11696 [Bacillus sonorensis L12]